MSILVTGGAGFIGSNFVLDWLAQSDEPVINLDKLTYAGNLENLASLTGDPRHVCVHGDICDRPLIDQLLVESPVLPDLCAGDLPLRAHPVEGGLGDFQVTRHLVHI